jgi:hypothetical protein
MTTDLIPSRSAVLVPCARLDTLPATPETVAVFLSSQASDGAKAVTLDRRVAAIHYAHRVAGHKPSGFCFAASWTRRYTAGSTLANQTNKSGMGPEHGSDLEIR